MATEVAITIVIVLIGLHTAVVQDFVELLPNMELVAAIPWVVPLVEHTDPVVDVRICYKYLRPVEVGL